MLAWAMLPHMHTRGNMHIECIAISVPVLTLPEPCRLHPVYRPYSIHSGHVVATVMYTHRTHSTICIDTRHVRHSNKPEPLYRCLGIQLFSGCCLLQLVHNDSMQLPCQVFITRRQMHQSGGYTPDCGAMPRQSVYCMAPMRIAPIPLRYPYHMYHHSSAENLQCSVCVLLRD